MNYAKILKKDPILKTLINQLPPVELTRRNDVVAELFNAVIGQQLSTKAAATIKNKFINHFSGDTSPQKILATPIQVLRELGLSYAKANYIHNIAQFSIDHQVNDSTLNKLSDQEIINLLTQIKGIGSWTVEMLLIFTMARENIFPIDDLGIQKSMIKLYKIEYLNKKDLKNQMIKISEAWSPYKSYASIYLWRSLDE